MNRRLTYLCLQATRQGQASYAHVHQIVAGLEALKWECRLFEPRYADSAEPVSLTSKLLEYARVQLGCIGSLQQASVLYVRDHPAAFPSILAARIARVPVVLEVNGPPDELGLSLPRLKRWSRALVWQFLIRCRSASAIIAVTLELGDWMIDRGVDATKISVIGNGADPDHFIPERDGGTERYAVFFGALAVWQGVDTMLRAAESPTWPEDVELWVAGDGVERPQVASASETLDTIRYLGTVPYDRMPGIVNRALVSLIVKNDLGDRSATGLSPLKLYESMAAGIPVIVSDLPGLREVVHRCGCGLIVPVDDPEALALAVAEIARNPETARLMGERAREAAVSTYSWKSAACRTHEVVLRCLEGRSADAD